MKNAKKPMNFSIYLRFTLVNKLLKNSVKFLKKFESQGLFQLQKNELRHSPKSFSPDYIKNTISNFIFASSEQNFQVYHSMPIKLCNTSSKERPNFDSFIGGDHVIYSISPWIPVAPSPNLKLKLFKILSRYSYCG